MWYAMKTGGRDRLRRRAAVASAVAVVASLVAVPRPGAAAPGWVDPAKVGAWTEPFEEGGAGTPRCVANDEPGWENGDLRCKPGAGNLIALPDGRVLYWDGVEGTENVEYSAGNELAPKSQNAKVRVMDLSRGEPQWTVPTPDFGGGVNREKRVGRGTDDPFGLAGVPGRPGDGLVGSTWGTVGGPEQNPTASPDDHDWNDVDLFCSDLAGMADGKVLVTRGIDWHNEPDVMARHRGDPADVGVVELAGLPTTRIFDPATNTFRQGADMHHGRYYPTLVELPDGKILAASGVTKLIKNTQSSNVRRTETYDPAADTWSVNYVGPASETTLPFVARLHLMPNGKILFAGAGEMWSPGGEAADMALWNLQQMYDPDTKTWEFVGLNPLGARDVPSSVLLPLEPPYDKGTVLTFGGALGTSPGGYLATPFSTLTTVTEDGTVTNEMTGTLNEARWSPAGIPLPDGTVLALGGARNSHPETPGFDIPVHSSEIYNPDTGKWRKVAPLRRDRPYHYGATLLADGRVLIGGNVPLPTLFGSQRSVGGPFANNNRDSSFEIYSPPYLFHGPRPTISHAPAGIAWGKPFELTVPDAGDIESVMLLKLQSQQHAMDSNVRSVKLAFARTGDDRLEVSAPPGGKVAPPGAYHLFVNRKNPGGLTPSVARIVFVGDEANGAEAHQPFPDDFAGITGGSATPVTASARGGDTYLGPAETGADHATAAAMPAIGTVQERTAQVDLTAVPVSAIRLPGRRRSFVE
jgi:hypothetical protein